MTISECLRKEGKGDSLKFVVSKMLKEGIQVEKVARITGFNLREI